LSPERLERLHGTEGHLVVVAYTAVISLPRAWAMFCITPWAVAREKFPVCER
jgi:hypothetical protein